jgi:hypothetical protein
VLLHRPIPAEAVIRSCIFKRDVKGWIAGFAAELPTPPLREGERAVGIDLGITRGRSVAPRVAARRASGYGDATRQRPDIAPTTSIRRAYAWYAITT